MILLLERILSQEILIDEEEQAALELEEERIREMEKMMEGDEDDEDEDEGEEENGLNKSQASILTGRPMSGKEARQQRFTLFSQP